MSRTRKQLKEKAQKLISIFGKECMVEQSDEHYIPQELRKNLAGYKKEEDKLYLYNEKYIVKGYNIRFLQHLTKEKRERVLTSLDKYKEFILKRKEDMER